MKIDRGILREVRFVALGTLFLSAVEALVFLALGKYDLSVLFGILLSGGAGVLNFFLLGLTVQKALSYGSADDAQARSTLKLSKTVRMLGLLAVLAVGVLLDCFSTVAVLVTVFFPRVTIFIRQIMIARANAKNPAPVGGEAPDDNGETPDGTGEIPETAGETRDAAGETPENTPGREEDSDERDR